MIVIASWCSAESCSCEWHIFQEFKKTYCPFITVNLADRPDVVQHLKGLWVDFLANRTLKIDWGSWDADGCPV